MDERIKQKWIERLRSGEIQQTKGVLGRGDGSRCCLGVLCDVAVEEGVISPPEIDEWGHAIYTKTEKREATVLPETVRIWSRLESRDPLLGVASAAHYNDDGASFEQIADLIQEHL